MADDRTTVYTVSRPDKERDYSIIRGPLNVRIRRYAPGFDSAPEYICSDGRTYKALDLFDTPADAARAISGDNDSD